MANLKSVTTDGWWGGDNSTGPLAPVLSGEVVGSGKIRLSWTKPDYVDSYRIERDGEVIEPDIDKDTTYYVDEDLPASEYSYVIVAENIYGETDSNTLAIEAVVYTDNSIIKSENGDLLIDIVITEGLAYLEFSDDENDLTIPLGLTAEQLSGEDWFIVKVSRDETTLTVTVDKETVATETVSVVNYSGNMTIMENKEGNIFDIRVIEKAISKNASDYYVDDLEQNGVNSMIPRY